MGLKLRPIGALALGLALAAAAAPKCGAGVVFKKIADSAASGPFSVSLGQTGVALGNSGVVAFRSGLRAGGSGVFTSSGGAVATIATSDSTGFFSSFGTAPSINDSGRVAFRAVLRPPAGGSGLFTGDGGLPTPIAFTAGPLNPLNQLGILPSINNAGQVAFQSTLDNGGSGIFVGDGGALTTVASTADSFLAFRTAPSINNAGTVAFYGETSTEGGIYTWSGGARKLLVPLGPSFLGLQDPTINDAGEVAFAGVAASQVWGVYRTVGGVPTLVDDRFAEPTSIGFNRHGAVAYLGDPFFDPAVYLNDGTATRRIIRVGDALDGSIVTSITFNRNGLNDQGMLAFQARLADGRVGVFTALAVPEPSTLASLSLGGLAATGLAALRRRKAGARAV